MDKIFVDLDEKPLDEQGSALFEEFAAMLAEESVQDVAFEAGAVVEGKVIEVRDDAVLVDIGAKSEGRIDLAEFRDTEGEITISAGDVVEVYIVDPENEEGQCVLSKIEADRQRMWDEIAKKVEAEETVRGRIISRVKGGLQVDIGVKAFLPGSQVELRPTRNLDKFIDQSFDFKIIKFNKKRGNIVLSRRALLEYERQFLKEKTLKKLVDGAIMPGQVKNITEYGAFVDLGGIDGLLHITDMSWGRVSHPEEVLKIGDEVTVKILKFNRETERVSLGMKQLLPDPWVGGEQRYPQGAHVMGRIVSLIDYGAFVELEEGIEGLIHISEMSWTQRVKHPSKVVSRGEIINCAVLKIDEEGKKISLGIKQLEPNPWNVIADRYPPGTRIRGKIRNITDFGIFIGIEDGIDGLVHISDMSWTQKIKHPSELYKKGEEVEAVVTHIDVEQERFSLSIKDLEENPWETLHIRMPPGTNTTAEITKLETFGAFAKIEGGIEGLIHISEISPERIESPDEVVSVGDVVNVEVISVDHKDQKIALSMRSYQQRADSGRLRGYDEEAATSTLGDVFAARFGTEEEAEAADKAEDADAEVSEEPKEVEASEAPKEAEAAETEDAKDE